MDEDEKAADEAEREILLKRLNTPDSELLTIKDLRASLGCHCPDPGRGTLLRSCPIHGIKPEDFGPPMDPPQRD